MDLLTNPLITFFMVVCSPCIFAENVHDGDLSCADAVINDTADDGDIIIDNADINDTAYDGDIIIDNADINDTAIFPMIVLPPKILHAEVERLTPFTYEDNLFGTGNYTMHSIKLRIVDDSGDGVSNFKVTLHTYYTHFNSKGVHLIDLLVHGTGHTVETDDDGYAVFNYAISSKPEMAVFCWITITDYYLFFPEYYWWDGINHSIYDQSRDFYK